MEMQEKLWKWYEKHKVAVDVVLDIACDMIPGSRGLWNAFHLVYDWASSKEKSEIVEEKKVQDIENFLTEIRPVVLDIVEDIEDMKEFQEAKDIKEKREIVEKGRLGKEVEKILPDLGQSILCSLSHIETKRILNNRYEIKKSLGKGGQGEVYWAWDSIAKLDVALKILPIELSQDTTALETVLAEYHRLVRSLVHDSIVQYRQLDKEERTERYFLVMDLVEGASLRKMILE